METARFPRRFSRHWWLIPDLQQCHRDIQKIIERYRAADKVKDHLHKMTKLDIVPVSNELPGLRQESFVTWQVAQLFCWNERSITPGRETGNQHVTVLSGARPERESRLPGQQILQPVPECVAVWRSPA